MSEHFEVRYTRLATRDIEMLHDWATANRSAQHATEMLDSMMTAIESLEIYPFRGSVPPEVAELGRSDVRQLSMPPYRLIYEIVDQSVIVMLIADARRDMRTLLRQRLMTR